MLNTIDRYLLRLLVAHYVIALAIMISLYVTLDMFVNMDEFTEQGYPVFTILSNIIGYYWPNVFLYFSQLSGVISLFACMAVIARMRRQNELTAILASGVSLYRVARPIVAFGIATSVLLVIDTELIIPSVAHLLARDHDDADGKHAYEILFLDDKDGALLSAGAFDPRSRDLRQILILKCDEEGKIVETIEADRAEWEPPDQTRAEGRWRLERGKKTVRAEEASVGIGPRGVLSQTPLRYYYSDLAPAQVQMRQKEGWINYLSLAQLRAQERAGAADLDSLRQAKQSRVASPVLGVVLLLLGLPFFLDRSPANVLSDAGKCLVACGLCYTSNFVVQSLRVDSAGAFISWLPIFVFTIAAVVMFDRIRT